MLPETGTAPEHVCDQFVIDTDIVALSSFASRAHGPAISEYDVRPPRDDADIETRSAFATDFRYSPWLARASARR
jgi:hypothetical protein